MLADTAAQLDWNIGFLHKGGEQKAVEKPAALYLAHHVCASSFLQRGGNVERHAGEEGQAGLPRSPDTRVEHAGSERGVYVEKRVYPLCQVCGVFHEFVEEEYADLLSRKPREEE